MAVGTRTVLALLGGVVLTVGVYLHATERESTGYAVMALGFATAGAWAFLGMELARLGRASTPETTYLSGAMAAVTLAMYFGIRARALTRGE
ncbi:hypothetical protein [Halobaculum magnesiiphilum]|uniref:Uncharacterized protein n=1 Tax=Halobaculum magnesiiphilum TaxID=1017351 RepID=A0A8T8WCW9_9EURY|nr:hypothetical protein [Halobaculum magnesiiphilum]QZP37685.1 hypothetical protein K6T50_00440 [Halobaculum magnesiiphilum]